MKLLIISHTEHYQSGSLIVGWGPTVREINHLTTIFDQIIHIAPLYKEFPPTSSIPYNSQVQFYPISPSGGDGLFKKLLVLSKAPMVIFKVFKKLKEVDYFQFRAPANIGVFLIPLLVVNKKPGWFKYAGDWISSSVPLTYRFQRYILKKFTYRHKVTINGKWNRKRKNILSFENPVMTKMEIEKAFEFGRNKSFQDSLSICFVGAVNRSKGAHRLVEVFNKLGGDYKKRINKIHIVGQIQDRTLLTAIAGNNKFQIHGPTSRSEIMDLYQESHFIFLLSLSEGFPKVIAEGIIFGCIPIVSEIPSLQWYINHNNGMVFDTMNTDDVVSRLESLFNSSETMKSMSMEAMKLGNLFSYDRYISRIRREIVKI